MSCIVINGILGLVKNRFNWLSLIIVDKSLRVSLLICLRAILASLGLSLIEESKTIPNEPYPIILLRLYFFNLFVSVCLILKSIGLEI